MNILIFFLIYNFLYIFIDILYRKYGNAEICRKIAHIGTGLITFFSLNYLSKDDYIFLVLIFLFEFILLKKYKLMEFMTKNKRGNGDIFFILGQGVLVFFMDYNIIYSKVGLLILTLADGLAPFGKYIWNKRIFKEKTFGGSLIFFLISLSLLGFFFEINFIIFILAFILTIIEAISHKGLDNILIPIFTIITLYFYDKIFFV